MHTYNSGILDLNLRDNVHKITVNFFNCVSTKPVVQNDYMNHCCVFIYTCLITPDTLKKTTMLKTVYIYIGSAKLLCK